MKLKTLILIVSGIFLFGSPLAALADFNSNLIYTFAFESYGDQNNLENVAIGEEQLSMTVRQIDEFSVEFAFTNAVGGEDSRIKGIVFADSADPHLLDFAAFELANNPDGLNKVPITIGISVTEIDGVAFELNNTNIQQDNSDLTLEMSNNASADMGVDPGERVAFTLNYATNIDFNDLMVALTNDVPSLTVGLHVGSMGLDEESEKFIDTYTLMPDGDLVPEPATLVLFGSGLIGLTWRSKRRQKK